MTRWPSCESATESLAATSARPPDLEYGETSDEAMTTL